MAVGKTLILRGSRSERLEGRNGDWPILIAFIALLAIVSVPVFSTVLPPLVDYPNHLARMHLLAEGGNQFYAARWAPLPDLAEDLIVPALTHLMPLDIAGKLFLVMIFALVAGGRCSQPRHRRALAMVGAARVPAALRPDPALGVP